MSDLNHNFHSRLSPTDVGVTINFYIFFALLTFFFEPTLLTQAILKFTTFSIDLLSKFLPPLMTRAQQSQPTIICMKLMLLQYMIYDRDIQNENGFLEYVKSTSFKKTTYIL